MVLRNALHVVHEEVPNIFDSFFPCFKTDLPCTLAAFFGVAVKRTHSAQGQTVSLTLFFLVLRDLDTYFYLRLCPIGTVALFQPPFPGYNPPNFAQKTYDAKYGSE